MCCDTARVYIGKTAPETVWTALPAGMSISGSRDPLFCAGAVSNPETGFSAPGSKGSRVLLAPWGDEEVEEFIIVEVSDY